MGDCRKQQEIIRMEELHYVHYTQQLQRMNASCPNHSVSWHWQEHAML